MTEHHVESTLRGWAEVVACLPDFSLHAFARLARLEALHDPVTDEILVVLECHAGGFAVALRLLGATGRLPESLGCGEMFIDDVRGDQLEHLRYHVYEESGAMHYHCRDAELAIRPRDVS